MRVPRAPPRSRCTLLGLGAVRVPQARLAQLARCTLLAATLSYPCGPCRIMRSLLLALLLVSSASAGFAFQEYDVPGAQSAPEPTIGIPWNTNDVFYHAYATTIRGEFDDTHNVTWTDVTPPYQVPINLDPMLHADPDTGRIFAGGLHGPCSIMFFSDDNGETWLPNGNMCSGPWFDHQSLGSGPSPFVQNALLPHSVYYCGQLGQIGCSASHDGGITFTPPQPVPGACGGFNGHVRVNRADGFVAVPVPACGGSLGFISTADGGITWQSNQIPGTERWTNGFDPSLQFGRDEGWMWYGMASEHGMHIGLSKDNGNNWEQLPNVTGNMTHWVDIGQFHDPPIVAGTFADVQVGDDDRVAFSFIGLEDNGTADREFLNSNQIYRCDARQEELIWHYYVAMTIDAGQNWTVTKLSEDPVQIGGVYDSVVGGGGGCRNLLDFNDMDIDGEGRVHIAFADGCVNACAETNEAGTNGYRAQVGKLYRQVAGPTLFAQEGEDNLTKVQPVQGDDEPVATPGIGFVAIVAIVALAAVRRKLA